MHWKTPLTLGLGLFGLAVLAKGYANSSRLELREETVLIPDLPGAFDGFRLLFLTDLHLRPRSTHVHKILTLIEELRPDLVCLGGDYITDAGSLPEAEYFFRELASYPAVGVYGNTDYFREVTRDIREQWAKLIPFLANSAMPIRRDGQALWVAGVKDPHIGLDRLDLALREVPPDAPVILLAHSPEIIRQRIDPRVRLILCGHTHGGQICLPGGKALYNNTFLPLELASGRHQLEHAVLYVSRGVGSTRLPLRLNCMPEATLFTLTRAGKE